MRWLIRTLEGLAVIVVVILIAVGVLIWRAFPDVQGETVIAGLDAPAQVIRDIDGVPHITAETSHDLFLTQGYVHAQDRFWQMDFWRHVSGGRLSELFGASQVDADSFLRTLGFHRIAAQEYEAADDELRGILDAYAEGVNAYLDERSGVRLSFEYLVVGIQNPGYEPDPWTPVDTLAWAKVMAWDLRASLDAEIERSVLSQTIPLEQVEKLYPPYPDDHPVIVREDVSGGGVDPTALLEPATTTLLLADVQHGIEAVDDVTGGAFDGIGSNNWVLSGSKTASGRPLLANDPHLGIQMPSIWYEVDLRCASVSPACPYAVTGFSFAGVPGVVLGHNARIAWGVTNQAPDSLDLFVERIDPTDPNRYEVNGTFRDMEVRTETIEVAGSDPVELEIRSTRHGPVISGLYGDLDGLEPGGVVDVPSPYAIAMRWTALEPARTFEAFLDLNRASDWDEFRRALSKFDIAGQNFVYADVDGHIGYQSTGRVPVRASGNGRYPVPGWTDDHEWVGFIDYEDMPREFDPERGFIATANQPVVDAADPRFIGIDHAYGFRAERIENLIEPLTEADVAVMQSIQTDTYDGSAETLVPALLAIESELPEVAIVQGVLGPWMEAVEPYLMDADSAGAATYAAVWRQVLATAFDELPEDFPADGNGRYFETVRRLLDVPDDPWWDEVNSPDRVERRDDVLIHAMQAAYSELVDLLGDDPSAWRWGDLHTASFENQTLGQSGIAPIEALFNRTAPPEVGGGSAIVNAIGWLASEGYAVHAVPSMRMVIDLDDLSKSVSVHTTGQSGHIFSRHYFDQNDLWIEGRAHPMRWTQGQIDTDTRNVLLLKPE